MEKATIIALLAKYWQAETTVEEEKSLAAWFHGQAPGTLDPDLEPYAALFTYFEEETRVSPGPDFESRILRRVTPVRNFRLGLIAAAAAVLVLVASLFLITPDNPTRQTPKLATATITDTYTDPEQALAAVRHALLIASVHLNEGRKQITSK